jgi:general secretion pathway protein F
VQNSVLNEVLGAIANELEQGHGLAKPLENAACFPDLAVQLVRVGEETGRMESMMMKLADIYDAEVQTALKRALALLEPALILVMGLGIAFIIVSILLAILGLNELVV